MSKFCGTCGSMAADEARVCGNCGTPFEAAQNNFVQPQNNFTQPQYQQSYQPVNMYAPAPAPKKSKKGIIIGAAVAVVAIIVAVVIVLSNGGGSKKVEKKESAKDVADKAISYLVKADAEALARYCSKDFADGYGTDELEEEFEYFTDEIEEILDYGFNITYEVTGDYESDELNEIQEEYGKDISDVHIYEYNVSFTHPDYGTENEYIDVIVWKNDGEWEFVTFD